MKKFAALIVFGCLMLYYRSRDDRKWIYSSIHYNRREARRAAKRLERRGYRTQILG